MRASIASLPEFRSGWAHNPRCAVCSQPFASGSDYSYVRGFRVCRNNDACIERASKLDFTWHADDFLERAGGAR